MPTAYALPSSELLLDQTQPRWLSEHGSPPFRSSATTDPWSRAWRTAGSQQQNVPSVATGRCRGCGDSAFSEFRERCTIGGCRSLPRLTSMR
jgi:hypothetical protein